MVAAKKKSKPVAAPAAPARRPCIACRRVRFTKSSFCLVHELEQVLSEVQREEYERAKKGLEILIAQAKSEAAS